MHSNTQNSSGDKQLSLKQKIKNHIKTRFINSDEKLLADAKDILSKANSTMSNLSDWSKFLLSRYIDDEDLLNQLNSDI